MLKKTVCIVMAALLGLSLFAGCAPEDDNQIPEDTEPSLDIVADESLLTQDENNVKEVQFTAVIKNAEGELHWFVNGVDRNVSSANFAFTPATQGTYTVYCKLDRGEQEALESKKLRIVVFGVSMDITVGNAGGEEALEQYVNAVKPVSFHADIKNIVGMTEQQALQKLSWYVNGEKQENTQGKAEFTYTPDNAEGYYDVYAEVDSGKTPHRSGFKRVYVRMGKVELAYTGNVEQKQGEESEVVFSAQTAGGAVDGQIEWYVNGTLAGSGKNEFSFKPSGVGAYRIGAKVGEIEAEAVYVICGVPVASEEELSAAYSAGAEAVFLTDDIEFQAIAGDVQFSIGRTFAIAGNGKRLTSAAGLNILMNVSADNVVLYNLTLADAGKYALQFYRAKDCYVEDVRLESSGYAGMHVNRSQVTAKDIVVDGCNYAGVELSHPDYDPSAPNDFPAVLTVLGTFTFLDSNRPAPIYTQDNELACRVVSDSFNEFIIVASMGGGEMIIRRWCNDGCNIGWTVIPPTKTSYSVGEKFDMSDIVLRVSVCGSSMNFDYEFLLMALDYEMTLKLDFIGLDGNIKYSWYSNSYSADGHLLFTDKDGASVDGIMRDTEIVLVKIDLAGVDIGKYPLSVSENVQE